jgi:hypothetical protein
MPTPLFDTRSDAHRLCWRSANNTHAWLVTPMPDATTTQNHITSSPKTPAAPLHLNSRHTDAAKFTLLPIEYATRKSELTGKSP